MGPGVRVWLSAGAMAVLAACASAPAGPALTPRQTGFIGDAASLCDIVRQRYVYFDGKEAAWDAACADVPARMAMAATGPEQLRVLEDLIDVLYDPHVSFGTNSDVSPRLVPSGNDYWLEDGRVTGVRPDSAAARAGLQVGDHVIAIDGQPLTDAVAERLRPAGTEPTEAQLAWAANAAAAGYRGRARSVTVLRDGAALPLSLAGSLPDTEYTPVMAERLAGNIGYIRFNNSLGDGNTVPAFDEAAASLKGARGWILDLRDTPGGGSTDIAEPVMGRFIREEAPYQTILPPDDEAWQKRVAPRAPVIDGPLAILVGRWTGSMGEGMAIGFDALRRGDVFGNEMAGLAGGVETFVLDRSGLAIRIPTYGLAHVDGTPRQDWRPPHPVLADNGAGPDLALQAASDWINSHED